MFLLVFILSFFQSSQYGRPIANDDAVFFYLQGRNINIVSHEGTFLNSIYLPKGTLPINSTASIESEYRFFHLKNDQLKIVSIPHGLVYASSNDTLQRIDVSYRHSMTHKSQVFKRNDTIFKFGGYGYWSARNFFTYFDDTTRQWEYYPMNSEVVPPGLYDFFGAHTNNDAYYVFQGLTVSDGTHKSRNKEIWKFDFNDKTWTNMGVSKLPLIHQLKKTNTGSFILGVEDDDYVYQVDFDTNTAVKRLKSNTSFTFFGVNALIVNDSLFNSTKGVFIASPLEKNLAVPDNNALDTGIYFDSHILFGGLYNAAILSLLIITGLIVFLKFRSNQAPRISELGIRFRGVSYYLTAKEKRVLVEILKQDSVPSQRIYDIVENPDLSYPQNNKIKNDTIKKINIKVFKILGIEDFIQTKKLDEDKRMLVYFAKSKKLFQS